MYRSDVEDAISLTKNSVNYVISLIWLYDKKLNHGDSKSIRRSYTFMNAYTAESAAGHRTVSPAWAVRCSLARVSVRYLCLKCISWCFLAQCRLVLVRTHRDTVNILTGHLYTLVIEILVKPPSNLPANKRLSLHYYSFCLAEIMIPTSLSIFQCQTRIDFSCTSVILCIN